MNLIPYYITISKICQHLSIRVSYYRKWIPSFLSLKRQRNEITKEDLINQLNTFLGDYSVINFNNTIQADKDEVIKWANLTLEHKFEYLGSGLIHLDDINWHKDFKSNFEWEKGQYYKDYKLVDLSNNADVKVPWELNRCHHLLWLGEAYILTNNEIYAKEIKYQIENWIAENPYLYSINWTCAMDVAIRSVNWIYAVHMIQKSNSLDIRFIRKLTNSLYQHGKFIYNNFEKTFPNSGNHYLANICGLLFIHKLFPKDKYAKKWRKFSIEEFYQEIRSQILPSGAHFERTISYHRLTTELLGYTYFMLIRTNELIPMDIHCRIRSMFDFVKTYSKENGLSPLLGDNDNGRFLPFVKRDFRKHSYLPNIYYNNLKNNIDICLDAFLLTSDINIPIYISDSGMLFHKLNRTYLAISNTGLSSYKDFYSKQYGTHTHADLLSFEFSIENFDVFVDPGTYVYSSDKSMRNIFRGTSKHNTIVIDNIDQNELSNEKMFYVNSFSSPVQLAEISDDLYYKISGSYKGLRIDGEMLHNRIFEQSKISNKLCLFDSIKYNGDHSCCLNFHLSEEIEPSVINNIIAFNLSNNYYVKMSINSSNDSHILNIVDDTLSKSYGEIINSKTIQIRCDFINILELTTTITWIKLDK